MKTGTFSAAALLAAVFAFAASAQQLPATVVCRTDNSDMVLVPAGKFIYGIKKTRLDSVLVSLSNARLPVFDKTLGERKIERPAFYIDKYEVTNRQYALFVEKTGHRRPASLPSADKPGTDQLPVIGVGWDDAMKYAAWAGKRLPTEEEWEKAARGTDGRLWPWGNAPTSDNYNGKVKANFAPVKVGSFPSGASPYGVFDMAGNVYEMTTGIFDSTSTARAMRGGCFLNGGAYTMTTFRWAAEDEVNGAVWLGFRCVADTTGLRDKTLVPAQ